MRFSVARRPRVERRREVRVWEKVFNLCWRGVVDIVGGWVVCG